MHDLQVVDVHTDREDLAVGVLAHEDAGIRVVELPEPLVEEPCEEHPLKAPAGLLDAVDGLLDAGNARRAVGVVLHVAWRHLGEDDLAVDELALEVGGDEVDAPYPASLAGGVGEERASGGVAERGGEDLVVVHA